MNAFSQQDPRWSRNSLGDSTTLTIGMAGCLISAIASMLADWGVATDPGRLNRWLRAHGGYLNGVLFRFTSVAGLGADLVEHVRCPYVPAPISGIDAALARGCAAVVELNAHPGQPHYAHWVRLLASGAGPDDRADYGIMDPWSPPGHEQTTLLAAYALPGWDAARVITAVAVYRHNTARVISFPIAATAEGPTQNGDAIYTSPGKGEWMGPKASQVYRPATLFSLVGV
jgi:hypothetical protein